ncbi:Malonyl-CoA decarboxylase [Cynara cardunculus var. scolymus]|uniref:Malonyl-CoA decarboxylase n=1 Tax=Cynara cardunculus var. scolymus TaxID=59895 RepID=A0A103Y230_CYNCS|nr:Malonyl-CoA decarboxylase [Cynara cardunculus var. scolymus]
MNKKGLAILLRSKMRPLSPVSNKVMQLEQAPLEGNKVATQNVSSKTQRDLGEVRESMNSVISMNKKEILDTALSEFSEGYFSLSQENRHKLLLVLAREYDLNRTQVRELMKQYIGLEIPNGDGTDEHGHEMEGQLSAFYRIERNLRHALQPMYAVLFERLNTHPGGLKFLATVRADILCIIADENIASIRALDSYLKEKLITWLSPANLELHQITWDDPASLLEKIVAYEAVHPISNLIDLKRRLGIGRRCFGYIHPAIPERAALQEVLWHDPPTPECEATTALFYSISSTQPGLAGINLGKFLIKRVIHLVMKDMPNISNFATLSPIPGFMQWLLSKLASSERSVPIFCENILEPEEERALVDAFGDSTAGKNGMEVLLHLLTSANHEWAQSVRLISGLKPILLRLCARYLLHEKKRGKALDSVANFHLQNGAMIGRLNWMADRSEKGLSQSGGIMVNYIYRNVIVVVGPFLDVEEKWRCLEHIEDYAQAYFSTGHIQASPDVHHFIEPLEKNEDSVN